MGLRGEQRPIGALDRDVHHAEGGDGLRLAVLEHLEVFLLQVADELALLVGNDRVHLDVLDLRLEGRPLCERFLRLSLSGQQPGPGEQHEGCGDLDACVHKHPCLDRIITFDSDHLTR